MEFVLEGNEVLAYASGVGGQLDGTGLGRSVCEYALFRVCGLNFEYDDIHTGRQGHDLGLGVHDLILEVRKVMQLGEAFYLYEFLGNRGVLISPGAARFHAQCDDMVFRMRPLVCHDTGN